MLHGLRITMRFHLSPPILGVLEIWTFMQVSFTL